MIPVIWDGIITSLKRRARIEIRRAVTTIEMPRNEAKSFCCGAGGAQMWKEEEPGTCASMKRAIKEAKETGAGTVAVGCPFCMTMLNDASKADGGTIQVKDVAELVVERMKQEK